MSYLAIIIIGYLVFELYRKQRHTNRLIRYLVLRSDIMQRYFFRNNLMTPEDYDYIKKEILEYETSVVDYEDLKKELMKIGVDVDKPASR